MKNKRMITLIIAGVLLIVMIAFLITIVAQKKESSKVKVGLVLSGFMDEEGWNGMHYAGAKAACDNAGIELFVREDVKEFSGKCEQAVEELSKEDVSMILLSSYGYSDEMKDAVSQYPGISFYVNSSENHEKNMTAYFVRMYQARYLAGVLAGMRTDSNQIGYVAAMPNNEVNRGISAFTLGVRSVNPDAEVVVIWTNTWDDSTMEEECTEKLIENCNVDVVTYHQNGATVIDTAEKYGVDSIGYHQQYEGYSSHYLTSVVCYWDKVYAEILKELMSGEANTTPNLWIGLREEAVGLTQFSSSVTEEEKQKIEEAETKILSGYEIFSGLIYDNTGKIQCNDGEMISDEKLLEYFDWYAQGVKFYEE